mgnify:CR=1 FL=1
MKRVRVWLVRMGLWVAGIGGWVQRSDDLVPPDLFASAKMLAAQVQQQFGGQSGEFKRAQVMRALINRHPHARHADCGLAIELAVR